MIDTASLAVKTNSSAYITDTSSVQLQTSSVTNLTLQEASGSNGSITIAGAVTAAGGIVNLSADGTGTITMASSTVAPISAVTVNFTSVSGNIGMSSTPVLTAAGNLSFNGGGNVYAQNTGAVYLLQSSAATTLNFANNGGLIAITGAVSAPTVNISTSAGNGITVKSSIGGNRLRHNLASRRHRLHIAKRKRLNHRSQLDLNKRRRQYRQLINGNTDGSFRNIHRQYRRHRAIYLNNVAFLTTLGSSASGGVFSLTDNGALTINNVSTSAGAIQIFVTGGALTVNSNAQITATAGNLTLQNTTPLTSSTTYPLIEVETGSSLTASNGSVYIVIGAVPAKLVQGSTPTNVTTSVTNPGAVYFGTNGIIATTSPNTVTANGISVVFSTGTNPAAAIQLDGNTAITAKVSPPVTCGSCTPISAIQSESLDTQAIVDTGDDGEDGFDSANMPVTSLP